MARGTNSTQIQLPVALDTNGLEGWLWEAACTIRGAVDAPKFKDYILPLIFVKRLSDVFEDEVARLTDKFGDQGTALELIEEDHSLVRFYIPSKASWAVIRTLPASGIGQHLIDIIRTIAKANPTLQGVIDIVDFNATVSGQRIIEDNRLSSLVEILNRHRLGLKDVEPDILGRAYEYLLRKFAEGQGQSAGEFFTPTEVGWLIARLLNPKPGLSQDYVTCNDRLLPLVTGMAGEYAEIVRTLVMEADQQVARGLGQKLAKGEALAQVLAERENRVYKPASVRAWMRGDAMPPADVLLAVARSAGISIDEASSRQPEGAQAPGDQRLDSLEGQVARLTEAVQSLQKEAVRERRRAERREWASRSTAASSSPHSPTPGPSSGRSRRI